MSGNMVDFFLVRRLEEGSAERIAIHTDEGAWTYGQVAALVCEYADRLVEVGPGERVVMAMDDSPDYVAALFAILAHGAVAVMINPDMTPGHLGAIIHQAQAPCALVEDRYLPQIDAAKEMASCATEISQVGRSEPPTGQPRAPSTVPTSVDDPAVWLFSGGTTGVPKIVVQRHGSFVNTTRRYAQEAMGYRPDDLTLAVPRLFFGYATGSALLFPFSVGAATVLFERPPTPVNVLEAIRRHRPTILVTTPSAITSLLSLDDATRADLASVRFATSAGEPLPESLYRRWQERFGVDLLDGLGTAEMWHIFITNRLGEARPGTVGKTVPGFEVVARDDAGNDVPAGETGLLWVKGDSGAIGYWDQPKPSAEVFRDGWVVSGDLISIDREGFVTHRGRADDAFKVKGKWLRPVEVESCLLEHPGVAEAAVVVMDDEDGLAKPIAFVVRKADVEEDDLRAHVLSRLEAYKHPRRVLFVDAFPRTHLGKVDRSALKRLASR